jgi:membrane protein
MLFQLFERFLPPPAFQLISQAFNGILQSGGPLKMSLGIIASLWSASLGVGAMMDTLNAAYNVKEARPLIKHYAVALGLTCGIGLLLIASVVVLIFEQQAMAALTANVFAAIAWSITRWLLALVAALLALAIMYFFGPNLHNRKWRWITPGAVVAVFLLMLVSVGSKAYIHYFARYDVTYGSLGAVIVLLLVFYLSGVAVLSGGVLNAVLENIAKTSTSEPW